MLQLRWNTNKFNVTHDSLVGNYQYRLHVRLHKYTCSVAHFFC